MYNNVQVCVDSRYIWKYHKIPWFARLIRAESVLLQCRRRQNMKVALQQVVQRHAFADQQHRVLLDYLQATFALSLCEHDWDWLRMSARWLIAWRCMMCCISAFVRNIFTMTESDQRIGFGPGSCLCIQYRRCLDVAKRIELLQISSITIGAWISDSMGCPALADSWILGTSRSARGFPTSAWPGTKGTLLL